MEEDKIGQFIKLAFLNETSDVKIITYYPGVEKNIISNKVMKKTKKTYFWAAINQYDKKDYKEIECLKGLYSFVLSIEKRCVEDCYSDKMKSLLAERGCETLKQLLRNCREIICIFLESMLIYVMNEFSDSGGHFHGT